MPRTTLRLAHRIAIPQLRPPRETPAPRQGSANFSRSGLQEMSHSAPARSGVDWQRAPKDGSLINIEFSGGEVVQARWDLRRMGWQVPQPNGEMIMLRE